mgnify:CR=1 FL=1
MDRFDKTLESINKFVEDRDWKKFHNPKDMATALSIEASELLELFLWVKAEDLDAHVKNKKEDISDEMADVAVYLFDLADSLDIDIFEAIDNKMNKSCKKYPIEKCKGNNKKYTEL